MGNAPPSGRSLNNVDPMPAARLGMWLFLSSETMFFVGLLSAFIVLGAGAQHPLFVKSSRMLSTGYGVMSVIMLAASSVLFFQKFRWIKWVAFASGVYFLLLQTGQWSDLLDHHTAVVRNPTGLVVLDGGPLSARQIDLPSPFDIHAITSDEFSRAENSGLQKNWLQHLHGPMLIESNYGPSRNNFFACYFLMSAAHIVHLLAGMIAVLWYLIFRKGKLPAAVQIYWHFVNVAGIVTILAVYFV